MIHIDWKNLPFGYIKTDYNIRCYYKNGQWGELEIFGSDKVTLHMAATCLHYGQEVFEGMKAFRGKDEKIRIFRCIDNARRMQQSGDYIRMATPPVELFTEAVMQTIRLNERFLPPYESGASLYIRPLLIGIGPTVGVKPAEEYLFLVFVTPVGPYFKTGFKPVNVMISRNRDRAAPLGTGHVKVGGNYAASLLAAEEAQRAGYSTALYLDAKEKKYIDECGPANFFAVRDNTYITPDSQSILPSITNDSLVLLAKDLGIKVERRQVEVSELESFEEAGECGTAAVITPIGKIFDPENNRIYDYGTEAGPVSSRLYHLLRAIQYGDEPDTHNWITIVDPFPRP
ncbi:MAG: branched-chain amino acid aminotransferase [Bacteroidales bacterium]|jgi:branched-chain amino acid aminotransferase|nr:branched-chain amino acid aminotransferase [Bacteroidales bacterium]